MAREAFTFWVLRGHVSEFRESSGIRSARAVYELERIDCPPKDEGLVRCADGKIKMKVHARTEVPVAPTHAVPEGEEYKPEPAWCW